MACSDHLRTRISNMNLKLVQTSTSMTQHLCQGSSFVMVARSLGKTQRPTGDFSGCACSVDVWRWSIRSGVREQARCFLIYSFILIHVRAEFLPQGQNSNAEFYSNILRYLREEIQLKLLQLQCHNVPSHSAMKHFVWPQKRRCSDILARFAPLQLCSLPKNEIQVKRSPFYHIRGDPACISIKGLNTDTTLDRRSIKFRSGMVSWFLWAESYNFMIKLQK